MSKGTIIDRVLTFYRTASPDVVRVTHALAQEVLAERKIGLAKATRVPRGRKPKPAAAQAASAAAAS